MTAGVRAAGFALSVAVVGCGQGGSETVAATAPTPAATVSPAPDVAPAPVGTAAPVSDIAPTPAAKTVPTPRSAVPSLGVPSPSVGPSPAAGVASPSGSPPADAGQEEIGPVPAELPVWGGDRLGDRLSGPAPPGGVLAGPGESGWFKVYPPPPWEGTAEGEVIGKVLDICDREQAFASWHRRYLEPGEDLADSWFAYTDLPTCDGPGPRYNCVTLGGWTGLFATRQEATAACKEQLDWFNEWNVKVLGAETYDHSFRSFGPEDESLRPAADEVAVLAGTVSVIDGVVRGLVLNRSTTLYARHVVVTAAPSAGGATWRWPLTMQPREGAPFEIAGWTGSSDPAVAAGVLRVTASLSPYLDITRSLDVYSLGPNTGLPSIMVDVELVAPSSHPSLAEAVMGQTISDLRAYAIYTQSLGDGTGEDPDQSVVVEVIELTPKYWVQAPGATEPLEQTARVLPLPPEMGTAHNPYSANFSIDFSAWGYPPARLWVGGANPPPADPPVLEPTDPPPRTPVVPLPGD